MPVFVAHDEIAMGTCGTIHSRNMFFYLFCGVAALAQTVFGQSVCTADEQCHFGSCDKKELAYKNVIHNLTTISCTHPSVVAVLKLSDPVPSNFEITEKLAKRCGALPRVRPCCETRTAKTELDTILITIASVVAIYSTIANIAIESSSDKKGS